MKNNGNTPIANHVLRFQKPSQRAKLSSWRALLGNPRTPGTPKLFQGYASRNALMAGYTLIEVVVALFIFAILAVIVMNTLTHVFSIRERQWEHGQRLQKLQLAFSILERDIQQIINRPIVRADGRLEGAVDLIRQRNLEQLNFTRAGFVNPWGQHKRSTLQRIGYYVKDQQLIREDWPNLDRQTHDEPQHRTLLSAVESIQWRFMDNENKFYDLWPPIASWQYHLPRAIEVNITLRNWGKIKRLFIVPEYTQNFALSSQLETEEKGPSGDAQEGVGGVLEGLGGFLGGSGI